jgi:hypothetical protein
MDLKTQLQELFEKNESDLGAYAWMYETDRCAELIFCLLNQYNPQHTEATRMAVSSIQYLGLLEIDKLALLEAPGNEDVVVLTYILQQHGFSRESAHHAVRLLAQVAKVMQRDYGGKVQRYLRRQGEIMRDELVKAFGGESLTTEQLRYAISHWLQNALSLPISLEHQAVTEFCKKNGVALEDLLRAADELNLNIALVDDLLEIDQWTKEATSEDQAPEEGG